MRFENYVQYEDNNVRQRQVGYTGQSTVELKFQNESGCGYFDPFVAVYVNGIQYDKVWAYIDREQGADGGWYSVVKFKRGNEAPLAQEAGAGG